MNKIGERYFVETEEGMREVKPFRFIKHSQDFNLTEIWGVEFSPMYVMDMYGKHLEGLILQEIANRVADEIVKSHLPEILAKIDQQAVATMCVASAGAKISETLATKIPDKILNIVTEKRIPDRFW